MSLIKKCPNEISFVKLEKDFDPDKYFDGMFVELDKNTNVTSVFTKYNIVDTTKLYFYDYICVCDIYSIYNDSSNDRYFALYKEVQPEDLKCKSTCCNCESLNDHITVHEDECNREYTGCRYVNSILIQASKVIMRATDPNLEPEPTKSIINSIIDYFKNLIY